MLSCFAFAASFCRSSCVFNTFARSRSSCSSANFLASSCSCSIFLKYSISSAFLSNSSCLAGQQMLGAARIPAQPLPTLAPPPSLPTFSQETKPLPLSGPSIPARNRDDATATADPELARKLLTLPPPLPPR